jgi:hypothetical protein
MTSLSGSKKNLELTEYIEKLTKKSSAKFSAISGLKMLIPVNRNSLCSVPNID